MVGTQALTRPGQEFKADDLQVIHQTVAKGTSAEQFKLFIKVCQYTGLNPFKRQIYAVVRNNQMTIQTSIDGYRLLAESTGKYAGQLGPWWCGDDGEWKEVWLKKEPPAAAKVGVLRSDFAQPVYAVAKYSSYYQDSSPLWKKMPDLMLAKCAEALVLRRVFPDKLSNVYTDAEMHQADSPAEQATTAEVVEGEVSEVQPQRPPQKPLLNGDGSPAFPEKHTLEEVKAFFLRLNYRETQWRGFKSHELDSDVEDKDLFEGDLAKLWARLTVIDEDMKARAGAQVAAAN